jgi:hypothetical protein
MGLVVPKDERRGTGKGTAPAAGQAPATSVTGA